MLCASLGCWIERGRTRHGKTAEAPYSRLTYSSRCSHFQFLGRRPPDPFVTGVAVPCFDSDSVGCGEPNRPFSGHLRRWLVWIQIHSTGVAWNLFHVRINRVALWLEGPRAVDRQLGSRDTPWGRNPRGPQHVVFSVGRRSTWRTGCREVPSRFLILVGRTGCTQEWEDSRGTIHPDSGHAGPARDRCKFPLGTKPIDLGVVFEEKFPSGTT